MFGAFFCHILKTHRVDRRRVWNDGLDFRTSCARCDAPLLRDPGGWRDYDAMHDGDCRREPHPRNRRR